MKVTRFAHHFYKHYVTRYDKALFTLILLNAILGGIYLLINQFTHQYTGINFIDTYTVVIVFPTMAIALMSMYTRVYSPNISLVSHTYSFLFPIILAMAISDNGIQLTPFSPIDPFLVSFDLFFHVHSVSILSWTHHHPLILHWLAYSYSALIPELLLIPLLIALLRERKMCRIFLLSGIIGYIFIQGIYYCFPTIAPAGILHSPFFTPAQHSCYIKFYNIHHYLKIPHKTAECLIAFPSPHVFCACITWYVCKNKKWLFSLIGIINISMIIATLFLGFHYFTDILGGISTAALSLYMAHRIDRWSLQDRNTHERLYADPIPIKKNLSTIK